MKIAVQDSFEESDIIMPMREIAAKIEKKQLLEKLDMLKKLSGDGEEVISKAEMLRVVKAKKRTFRRNQLPGNAGSLISGRCIRFIVI